MFHRTVGLVEPRCNTMPNGTWKYKAAADSPALCSGFYWQFSNDDRQLLNATDVMRAVASSRCSWYRAIEAAENDVDKTIREYQEDLRLDVTVNLRLATSPSGAVI